MLKSMTAYGQATLSRSWGQLVVQIQSVNRRFLEFSIVGPKEFFRFEQGVKKLVGTYVSRGQIQVRISAHFNSTTPLVVKPNLALAFQIQGAARKLSEQLNIPDLTEHFITQSGNVLEFTESLENEDTWREDLEDAVRTAMDPFMEMKRREGAALQKDIAERLASCVPRVDTIEELVPAAIIRQQEKLLSVINEIGLSNSEHQDKVLREVAIYADKIDITEELVRFRSHVCQFGRLMEQVEEKGVGKPLEFLLQELLREVNTMSSKSSDAEVTRLAVEIKSELERIREQLQNVE